MTWQEYRTWREWCSQCPEEATEAIADARQAERLGLSQEQIRTMAAAKTVRQAIYGLGLTQSALSERIGIPLPTIEAWCAPDESERHRIPPRYLVDLIIFALISDPEPGQK